MRMTTLARTGAMLTSTALIAALSTGAATADAGDATLTALTVRSSVITGADTSYAGGDIRVTLAPGVSHTFGTSPYTGPTGKGYPGLATLTLDGVNRGQIPVYFKNGKERYLGGEFQDGVEPYPGVDIPRTWGSGVAQLTNIVVFTTKGGVASQTPVGGASHRFFVRKNIKVMRADNIGLLIKRSNNTVTFKAQRIRIINPSTGKYQSAGSVKLQYRSDGVWRTTKTIRLNSLGDGSFSRTISRKYPYRLRIAKTSRNIEFLTKVSGRI